MATPSYQTHSKFADSIRESIEGPYLTGNVSNPLYQANMSTSKRQPQGEPFNESSFPYSNGNELAGGPPQSARAPLSERHNSINSTMTGRYYDRMSSRETLLGPRRPRPHKIWKKKFIKVLVVGDSGLGKTTLIKTLLSTPGDRLQVHDGSTTPSEQFRKDPESLCSTVTWQDEEDRVVWVYRIQDTPGYGDDLNIMNHITMMLDFIERQNLRWLEMESARDREKDLAEVEDPRVDVCLFCLPPHRLRPIDIRYMWELGRVVPIIPVITKADTMTIREATIYKQDVYNKLQNTNIPGIRGKIHVFPFAKETLDRAGLVDTSGGNTPPFLVIASNDINEDMNAQETPVFWPERRYPWGTAEAFNPDHSDLLHLRALLLKEALEEISKSKRMRYEDWRRRVLGGFKWGRKLRNMFLFLVLPVAAGVYVGKSGMSYKDVAEKAKSLGLKIRDKLLAAPVAEPPPPPPTQARRREGWF